MKGPNFLILMADQLTARALPAYGNRTAKTPNIDALAAAGVVFESFYCNSPLCAPSRFSFLSGRQVSAIGAYDNAAEFPAQVPTFAHYLRGAGYRHDAQRQDAFLRAGPAARLRGAPDDRHLSGRFRLDAGLDPLRASGPGWYHTMDSVTQAGPCTRTNQIDFDDEVVFRARQKLFDIARGKDRRPFCMVVSMTHPHDPYAIPQPLLGSLCRRGDRHAARHAAAGRLDPHSRRLRHVCGLDLASVDRERRCAPRGAHTTAPSPTSTIRSAALLGTLGEARFAEEHRSCCCSPITATCSASAGSGTR